MVVLSVPSSIHLRSAAAATRARRSSGTNRSSSVLLVRASLKQDQENRGRDARTCFSPLRMAEEIASRFGLEMAIAELERLMRQPGVPGWDGPHPGPSGRPVRVAYQGTRGSYCQEAAALAFPSSACEAFPCGGGMEEAFAALEDRSADCAVVPAENSLDGPIDRNLDLLLRHPGVRIVGELVLPVCHCLLSLPSAPPSALRRVVSHPQALAHCAARLRSLGLSIEEVPCTAEAARLVAEGRMADTAVVGSGIAAREFGLRVLERGLQDPVDGGNYNRFLQLGLGPTSSTGFGGSGAPKTTVAFSLVNGASDLFQAMWALESRGVRVTRVDHRPNRRNPVRVVDSATYLDYVFVLDVDRSESDPSVKHALHRLAEMAGFVRVLGSYTCVTKTTRG